MKPNPKTPETYANRCAQFLKGEKLHTDATTLRAKGKAPISPEVVATENPYLLARVKVLAGYKEGRRIEIAALERDHNLDNRWYAEFISDIVVAAGDTPSLKLRNYIKGI